VDLFAFNPSVAIWREHFDIETTTLKFFERLYHSFMFDLRADHVSTAGFFGESCKPENRNIVALCCALLKTTSSRLAPTNVAT